MEGKCPKPSRGRRPILLAIGKEDKDLLNKLIPPVDAGSDSRLLADRVCQMQKPITSFSVKAFQIPHALLCGLDYCLKLVYKLNSKVNECKQISPNSNLAVIERVTRKTKPLSHCSKRQLVFKHLPSVGHLGTGGILFAIHKSELLPCVQTSKRLHHFFTSSGVIPRNFQYKLCPNDYGWHLVPYFSHSKHLVWLKQYISSSVLHATSSVTCN